MFYYKLSEVLEAVTAINQIIVRLETMTEGGARSKYRIYDDIQTLFNDISKSDNKTAFHEITRTDKDNFSSPQRLYFDIDLRINPNPNIDPRDLECIAISNLKDAVNEWFREKTGKETYGLVASSSDYKTKVSLHVIFPEIAFKSYLNLGRIANEIRKKLNPWLYNAIDTVYKRNQGLRILFSYKLDTTRQKLPIGDNWPADKLRESLIHKYGDMATLDEHVPLPKFNPEIEIKNHIDKILIIISELEKAGGAGEDGGHRQIISDKNPNIINLVRTRPSFCPLCKRIHNSENYYVTIRNKSHYYLHCRREGKSRDAILIYVDQERFAAQEKEKEKEKENEILKTVYECFESQFSPTQAIKLPEDDEHIDFREYRPAKKLLVDDDDDIDY
mgnify:CR=1 FL=1